ncbi:MAG: HNH endonuclease family protein [Acetatifactor sp.]
MDIQEHEITIRDLFDGYIDNQEDGVFGYHGKLNIRPAYQRELVYTEDKQRDVIKSVRNGFPLNVMYFMENEDGTFELLDGQQRTLSICRYCDNQYSLNFDGQPKQFHNLGKEAQDQILDYTIKVYFCKGTVDERKKWFEIINFKGEALTRQELLNAIYSGPWVTDAKRYFSKTGCAAYQIANDYLLNKSAIRQEIFETALKWIANSEDIDYEEYMAIHQHDDNATPLWEYFKGVIEWVEKVFGCPDNYRSHMKKVDWGILYNKYHQNEYDSTVMEEKIAALVDDYEVSRDQGAYEFVFDGDPKHLSLRTFDERTKKTAYKQQNGICPICQQHFEYSEMQGDHWKPWSKGGTTTPENCKMLCVACNIQKSNKQAQEVRLKAYLDALTNQ